MCLPHRAFACTLLAILATPLLMAGCRQSTVSQSRLSAAVPGGRQVVAVIDGPGFISGTQNGGAIVSFAGKKVEVEKDRLLIDGVAKASIPADAKKVELRSSHGTLSVVADGKPVYTSAP